MKTSLLAAATLAFIAAPLSAQPIDPKIQARIDRILKATPLIDGGTFPASPAAPTSGPPSR
jgi:membrane dipeptidase